MYQSYKHKHCYVYKFVLENHKTWPGTRYSQHEYVLCTDVDGPNSKENRKYLEQALRAGYGHFPKTVKYSHER